MDDVIGTILLLWFFCVFCLQAGGFLFYNVEFRKKMYDLFNSDLGKNLPFHAYYEGKLWDVDCVRAMGIIESILILFFLIIVLVTLRLRSSNWWVLVVIASIIALDGFRKIVMQLRERFVKDGNIGRGALRNVFFLQPVAHLSVVPTTYIRNVFVGISLLHVYIIIRIML
jgi:hypothetical protein